VCLLGHDRTHVGLECVHASRACAPNLHLYLLTLHSALEGSACPAERPCLMAVEWMCCEQQPVVENDTSTPPVVGPSVHCIGRVVVAEHARYFEVSGV
jgi:hypothetical protein